MTIDMRRPLRLDPDRSLGRHRLRAARRSRVRSLVTSVRQNSLYRNSLLLMANYLAAAGLGFLYWIVASHFYSVTTIGLVSALLAAIQLCAAVATIGMPNTLIRFSDTDRDDRDFIRLAYVLVGLVAGLGGVVIGLIPRHLGVPLPSGFAAGGMLIVFVMAVAASALGMLGDAVIIANRASQRILLKSIVAGALKLLTLPALAGFGIAGLFGSTVLGMVVATAIGGWFVLRRASGRPSLPWDAAIRKLRARASFSAHNHVAVVGSLLPTTLLPAIVVVHLGAAAGAYVAIPLLILGILNAVPGMTAQSLFAEISTSPGQLAASINRALRWIYLLVVPAVSLTLLCAHWILGLFGAGYAAHATTCLQLMALGVVPASFNYVADVALNGLGKHRAYAVVNLCGALALLGACCLLMSAGPDGIGLGWLIGQLLYSVIAGGALLIIKKIQLPLKGYRRAQQ